MAPDDSQESDPLLDVAAGMIDALGGDGDELREEADKWTGDGSVTGAAVAGVTTGTALVEQRRQFREHAATPDQVEQPAIRLREIGDDGGAVRVMVSDVDAEVYAGDDSILISGDGYSREEPMHFDPHSIEEQDVDGIAEFVVRGPPKALPEGVEESDQNDVEDALEPTDSSGIDLSAELSDRVDTDPADEVVEAFNDLLEKHDDDPDAVLDEIEERLDGDE